MKAVKDPKKMYFVIPKVNVKQKLLSIPLVF